MVRIMPESFWLNKKHILVSDLSLTHFNLKFEVVVGLEASECGIGVVILYKLEDGRTKSVTHASRTLFEAEKNYSQMEKESLAINALKIL